MREVKVARPLLLKGAAAALPERRRAPCAALACRRTWRRGRGETPGVPHVPSGKTEEEEPASPCAGSSQGAISHACRAVARRRVRLFDNRRMGKSENKPLFSPPPPGEAGKAGRGRGAGAASANSMRRHITTARRAAPPPRRSRRRGSRSPRLQHCSGVKTMSRSVPKSLPACWTFTITASGISRKEKSSRERCSKSRPTRS